MFIYSPMWLFDLRLGSEHFSGASCDDWTIYQQHPIAPAVNRKFPPGETFFRVVALTHRSIFDQSKNH